MRAQLGDSLKSALRYSFQHDTFDDPFFPLRGFGLRCLALFPSLMHSLMHHIRLVARSIPRCTSAYMHMPHHDGFEIQAALSPGGMVDCIP